MKKTILSLIALTSTFSLINANAAQVVRIYNQNTQYNSWVNYQACLRDVKNKPAATCFYHVYHVIVKEGKKYADIKLPDAADYAKVLNAYEYNKDQGQVASGQFPGEEDCKVWPGLPVTLDDKNSDTIICVRS